MRRYQIPRGTHSAGALNTRGWENWRFSTDIAVYAARVVSGTRKYDRGLTQLLHAELHWLDVADRVTYKFGWMAYKCLHGQAPEYLSELCMQVAQVAERQHLRSASRNLLVTPRFQLDTYGRHCLCRGCTINMELTVGRTANSGPPQCHLATQLKDVSTSTTPSALSALEALCDYALYKSIFAVHLHYIYITY